jgi:hypothetical protein
VRTTSAVTIVSPLTVTSTGCVTTRPSTASRRRTSINQSPSSPSSRATRACLDYARDRLRRAAKSASARPARGTPPLLECEAEHPELSAIITEGAPASRPAPASGAPASGAPASISVTPESGFPASGAPASMAAMPRSHWSARSPQIHPSLTALQSRLQPPPARPSPSSHCSPRASSFQPSPHAELMQLEG